MLRGIEETDASEELRKIKVKQREYRLSRRVFKGQVP